MRCSVEYLIVGAGLTGSVIARRLSDAGRECAVMEIRDHIGGNCYDFPYKHSDVFVHRYGPHLFRTRKKEVWDFVNRFVPFYEYRHFIKTWVNGRWENWPVSGECIRRLNHGDASPEYQNDIPPKNFRDAALQKMPKRIYELFVKGYTEKQWGAKDIELAPELAGRFHVAWDDDPCLFPNHDYQGLPRNGYVSFFNAMLDGIDVQLNSDFLEHRNDIKYAHLIFTGPIDLFFNCRFGALAYRGQRYEHEYFPDIDGFYQVAPTCNFPNNYDYVRVTEWKWLTDPDIRSKLTGTVITRECPFTPNSPDEFFYPYPDRINQTRAAKYRALGDTLKNVTFCGRLGEYRYLDMDHAIENAFKIADNLLDQRT